MNLKDSSTKTYWFHNGILLLLSRNYAENGSCSQFAFQLFFRQRFYGILFPRIFLFDDSLLGVYFGIDNLEEKTETFLLSHL